MRNVLVLILAYVTSFEVYQTVLMAKKWNYYKITANKEKSCPDQIIIVQRIEHNLVNSINIDSFLQVYGITVENMKTKSSKRKNISKVDMLIEPSKIVPEQNKIKIKIKVKKSNDPG